MATSFINPELWVFQARKTDSLDKHPGSKNIRTQRSGSKPERLTMIRIAVLGLDEGEHEGDKGGHLEDDERHVLQCLPYQLQERLGRLGRDRIGPKCRPPVLQVRHRSAQPYKKSAPPWNALFQVCQQHKCPRKHYSHLIPFENISLSALRLRKLACGCDKNNARL